MNSRQRFGIAAGLVVLSAIASVLAAPDLPAVMVSHWNAAGTPNGTMAKPLALALVPAIGVGLLALFAAIPRIDPLRENIAAFRPYYDWLVVIVAGFLLAIHLATIAFNLGYAVDMTVVTIVTVAVLYYYLGMLLPHAERNWFVGIRTPWTLSSPDVWERTHVLGGRLFKLSAVLALVGLLFGSAAIYFVLVPALLTAGITFGYSYLVYERLERDGPSSPGLS